MARTSGPSCSYDKDIIISPSLAQLSPEIRLILDRLRNEALVPLNVLANQLAEYTNELEEQAEHTEFFDLSTAKRTADLCRQLLDVLPTEPDPAQHRLAQLAIRYFVLAEDAEDDNRSLIGFDDDLQVVTAAILELGLDYLLKEGATNG